MADKNKAEGKLKVNPNNNDPYLGLFKKLNIKDFKIPLDFPEVIKKLPEINYTYLEVLKQVFFEPTKFFKNMKKEQSYYEIWLYFFVLAALSAVAEIVLSIPIYIINPLFIILALLPLFALILIAITPFSTAAINHIGVIIFGGKKGFINTYRPTTFALSIGFVYGIIINTLLKYVVVFNENIVVISSLTFIVFVISIVALIHFLYVGSVGISIFQEISKLKSFLSIIAFPIIIILVMFFILALMLVSFFLIVQ